jgi:thiol-disulfide isomerase/thioredoxin
MLLRVVSFLLLLSALSPLRAQFAPDTALTYEQFLKSCQEFARQPRQEIWVVNFWATYNARSMEELPALKRLQAQYGRKPVRFISISLDKSRMIWERLIVQFQMPWEQMFLPDGSDYAFLRRAFRHNSLPALFLVNSEAQIIRLRNPEELAAELPRLTADLPNQPWRPASLSPLAEARPSRATQPLPAELPLPGSGWQTHSVQQGETLYGISRRYNVPLDQLRKQNGLSSDAIRIGMSLKIKKM